MSGGTSARGVARRGQAAAALRARPRIVGLALLKQTPVLALVPAVPGLFAWASRELDLALALLAPTAVFTVLGVASTRVLLDADIRRIEAVVTLALIFVVASLSSVPGFIALGLSPLDAIFEAVSGITTTGLSVATDAENWPVAGHALRGWLQWCGGVAIAVAGVALLVDAGRAAQVLGQEAVDAGDVIASTRARARLVLTIYGVITAVAIGLSIPLFPGWWEGPMVVLAAVSTGGFSPRDTSLAEYTVAAQSFALALCILTSVSLLFYAAALRVGVRRAITRGTVPVTLALIAVGSALYALWHGLLYGFGSDLLAGVLNYVSAHTTAGFSVSALSPTSPLLFLMIAAMALGGDVGSTTGGLKTARTLMLLRMVGLTFLRLRLPPKALSHLKIGERRADAEEILFAAALLTIYLIAMIVLWAALVGAGHPALAALFDTVSTLSCVGHSTGVIGPALDGWLKALVTFGMLIGRLEFFAVIALLLPSTWFSRR